MGNFLQDALAQKQRASLGLDMSNPRYKRLVALIDEARATRERGAQKLAAIHNNTERMGEQMSVQAQLGKLKESYMAELNRLREEAFAETFGLQKGDAMEMRDARSRALAIPNETTAKTEYALAKISGDTNLIGMIAWRSFREGWRPILTDFFDSFEQAQMSWMLFGEADAELNTAQGQIRSAAFFRSSNNTGATGEWLDSQSAA